MMKSDQDRREQLYKPMREEGVFTWDWMYGEEYALADIHLISREFREELSLATERLGRIFAKVVPVLQQADPALLLELGVPQAAIGAVRTGVNEIQPTMIGRFDFAQTTEGLKMLECNSDTPTGIVEAYYVNGRACHFFNREDPNAGMEAHLRNTFARALEGYRRLGYETRHIWFSSLDWHEEDKGTTQYLLRLSGLPAQFAPLELLRVWEDRLYVKEGEDLLPVDVLYRLHALEKLAIEKDEDGYPTGEHVLALIAERKLAIMNPPSAFLIQTKALQALIWNLHESNQFFTAEEQTDIEKYMLPTYFENRFAGVTDYVTKPIFGREGGGVVIFAAQGEVLEKDQEEFYWEQPMIYQKRVELPKICVQTEKGSYDGRLLWGSFWIGGKASALVARVGGPITNNLSYYLPVGIEG
ncbi:glutathionylspermidine synthase [Brevibacillus reuszeri]|uniref:Glutathionylspermidine synthase n=1 Tax=Brevibacillus reuszeri TaxID=54915 RepID=A0A0K9YKB6_9BACL|nr:glutathionylspermidine synthase family protein [Brevibacillus reuszeri]KNB68640.1 glutathionylspermidine synthase [Brevibacillus reuszeri]MED1858929.1 glutathionylspermidine synthase family protein [Brevibacillus reuszeri]GED69142.1 glutathionylspermidine synthase [Brevibacillus reuszeri]